jgi:2-dehydro-3-deoxygluconokinase
MQSAAFAAIGECMIELSGGEDDRWRMGFAGDTFNTAWYARAILPARHGVAYVTALGDDPFSARLRGFIADAGIAADRLRTVPGRRPGLYAISLEKGERSFTYWRGQSAARCLADDARWLAAALDQAGALYFSGITLAILAPPAREHLLAALAQRRAAGARIAFDTNFRPALWPDLDEARAAMQAACRIADVALPSFDDEQKLFGDTSPEQAAGRIAALGPPEVIVKNAEKDCLLRTRDGIVAVAAETPKKVVDTTGAGDSFAGAYLAGRILGLDPPAAARLGHRVAAQVVGVHGALMKIDRAKALAELAPTIDPKPDAAPD